jgi:Family of unknown function (DUF5330)
MGILRNTLVIGAIALAMPSPPPSELPDGVVAPTAGTFAYLAAATSAFADVKAFCDRQADVCSTAGHLAHVMEAKAKYSAKLIYEWASETTDTKISKAPTPDDLAEVDVMATGTAEKRLAMATQSTLRLEDLLVAWDGPVAPPES